MGMHAIDSAPQEVESRGLQVQTSMGNIDLISKQPKTKQKNPERGDISIKQGNPVVRFSKVLFCATP